jgi:hypothetical protein
VVIALYFGVLRGKVDIFKREDDLNTPHLQIKVIDGNGEKWRIAVNVLSSDKSFLIFHRAEPLQSHPLLGDILKVNPGFTLLPEPLRSATTSLDYFRAPLFDWPPEESQRKRRGDLCLRGEVPRTWRSLHGVPDRPPVRHKAGDSQYPYESGKPFRPICKG